MERYAEIVAALKIRTSNKKGRHLSTARAIQLLEEDGVETPDGLVRAPAGLLKRATVDRVLRASGLDHARVSRPVAAVRFQAKRSNELWHFDMSPSDLKQVEAPLWIEQGRGKPTLMLFSAVDDRSGVVYDEYRCVYGEDAESALRFLFNAMAPKPEAELPFQGIPATIYMDNGPVSRSKVFQSVMGSLGVRVLTHMPPSEAERRTPARSKGKVETAVPHHQGGARDALPLPQAEGRGGGESLDAPRPRHLQQRRSSQRAVQPGRGLAEASAAKRRARDVLMGAVLRFRARA